VSQVLARGRIGWRSASSGGETARQRVMLRRPESSALLQLHRGAANPGV